VTYILVGTNTEAYLREIDCKGEDWFLLDRDKGPLTSGGFLRIQGQNRREIYCMDFS
jgi:hypothetical protein